MCCGLLMSFPINSTVMKRERNREMKRKKEKKGEENYYYAQKFSEALHIVLVVVFF
jgi:hypothetical protein